MRPLSLRFSLCLSLPLVLTAGCAGGPYSLDLSVVRKISGSSVTTAFQIDDGGKPVERRGTVGVRITASPLSSR